MTVSQSNNITLTALAVAPANLTTDPYQTTQALSGLIGQLAIWTRHVADSLNVLYRAGTITNGMLLIGDATNSVFDLGTLTAGSNVTITNGAGTITVAAPGAIPPNPGTSGGIPYYNTTTTLASSALLAANALVQGGGAGTAPFTAADWSIVSNILQGNLNSASLPTAPLDTIARVAQADGHGTVLEMLTANNGSNVFNNVIGRQSRGTLASPTATQTNDVIQQVESRGYDNTNGYATGATGAFVLNATENWTSTAHGTNAIIYGTPKGSLSVQANITANSEGVQVRGTNTNDNAPVGFYGEYGSSLVSSGSTVNLPNGIVTNITSITPAAGDYEFWGEVWFDTTTGAPTGNNFQAAGITTTSATFIAQPSDAASRTTAVFGLDLTGIANPVLSLAPCRISTTGGTTVYLIADVNLSGGTIGGYGKLAWRRIR